MSNWWDRRPYLCDVCNGAGVKIMKVRQQCGKCGGSGRQNNNQCQECRGAGFFMKQISVRCSKCGGTGGYWK